MDFKIIWTDSAIGDLKEICGYISRDNPSAAEKTGRGILGHVKILETFRLSDLRIRVVPAEQFERLYTAIIEFFMKWRRQQTQFASCASGTEREANLNLQNEQTYS